MQWVRKMKASNDTSNFDNYWQPKFYKVTIWDSRNRLQSKIGDIRILEYRRFKTSRILEKGTNWPRELSMFFDQLIKVRSMIQGDKDFAFVKLKLIYSRIVQKNFQLYSMIKRNKKSQRNESGAQDSTKWFQSSEK